MIIKMFSQWVVWLGNIENSTALNSTSRDVPRPLRCVSDRYWDEDDGQQILLMVKQTKGPKLWC